MTWRPLRLTIVCRDSPTTSSGRSAMLGIPPASETTSGRFATDNVGYRAMRKHVAGWPDRTWAVEGSNGAGRPLAQRLLADGEHVVDVPA